MPPRVTGELPGITPRIQASSGVVRGKPEEMAFSVASSRAKKGAASAVTGKTNFLSGAFFVEMAEEKSAIFLSPAATA
jgi:hypothetical protein